MLFTVAVSQQTVKCVLRALDKLLKNKLEHNTKNESFK
ncbi:hypothetical protein T05_10918 [Trichinella murrelli]|uniref:Uncharacterized protein n=1 Tax=Trichinella murrelli TaxID=144512 RepID=A0A0V0SP89_9BILA|nr:hypothetical protein T05_10918 [Trichinella murrelli]